MRVVSCISQKIENKNIRKKWKSRAAARQEAEEKREEEINGKDFKGNTIRMINGKWKSYTGRLGRVLEIGKKDIDMVEGW